MFTFLGNPQLSMEVVGATLYTGDYAQLTATSLFLDAEKNFLEFWFKL